MGPFAALPRLGLDLAGIERKTLPWFEFLVRRLLLAAILP